MKGTALIAATAIGALAVAGCGSSSSSGGTSASGTTTKACVASIGMEGPLTGPVAVLGQEQLHFAQLALARDNLANHTKITLVQGDTQLNPAQATTVTQQFTSNSKIVAVPLPFPLLLLLPQPATASAPIAVAAMIALPFMDTPLLFLLRGLNVLGQLVHTGPRGRAVPRACRCARPCRRASGPKGMPPPGQPSAMLASSVISVPVRARETVQSFACSARSWKEA